MDIADIAGEREEQMRADALARQVGKSAPESHPEFDGEHCVDCGEVIPPERLAMGKVRDVPCQSRLELRRRMGVCA